MQFPLVHPSNNPLKPNPPRPPIAAIPALFSLQDMADFATSAAATGLASKQGGDGKGVMGGKLGREMVVVLFKKWVRSEDRTKARTEKIPVFLPRITAECLKCR